MSAPSGKPERQTDACTDVFGTPGLVEAAMKRGVRDALLRHKLLGESIAVWRDGKVVIVPADEIVVPELPDERPISSHPQTEVHLINHVVHRDMLGTFVRRSATP